MPHPTSDSALDAVTRYGPALRRLALALVQDPSEADDVVQDTWVALAEERAQIRSLGPYLASLVRSLASRRRRAAARRRRREEESARGEALPSTATIAARTEIARRLAEGLEALPEPYRTTLALRYLDEVLSAELARRAGIPSATVRARVARGLALMRLELDRAAASRPEDVNASAQAREDWRPVLVAWTSGGSALHAPSAEATSLVAKGAISTTRPLAAPILARGFAVRALALFAMKPFIALLVVGLIVLLVRSLDGDGGALGRALEGERTTRTEGNRGGILSSPSAPDLDGRLAVATSAEVDRADLENDAMLSVAPPPEYAVRARLIAWDGASLAGCELALATRPEFRGTSESGGRVELLVPRATLVALGSVTKDRHVEFLASGPGLAATSVRIRPDAQGDVLELGELVLQPGSAVGGQVVDALGLAVEGALVVLHPGHLLSSHDQLRSDAVPPDLDDPGSRGPTPPLWTRSAADGSFHFPSVPRTRCVVWARGETSLWTHSASLDVQIDGELRDIELALVEGDSRTITGRLLDPEGAPIASHAVQLHPAGSGNMLAYTRTAPDGSFHLTSQTADTPYDLSARALGDRWADLRHGDVLPGTHDIVLQFEVAPSLRIEVVDDEGRVVRGAVATLLQPERWPALPLKRGTFVADAGGRLSVRRHETPIRVRVAASGYRDTIIGPLDPESCGEVLHVELERVPALVGRVTLPDGRPAAGAEVSLHVSAEHLHGASPSPQITGLTHADWNGDGAPFVHRLLVDASATVTADADGHFRLLMPGVDTLAHLEPRPPENEKRRVLPIAGRVSHIDLRAAADGSWYLRATSPGATSSTSGPHRFDPTGDEEIHLVLPPGGALAGDLRVEGQADAAGWSVHAADGLGQLTRAWVDAAGAFRFEALHEGPWQVRAFAPGRACSLEGANMGTATTPTIDVEVQAGLEARIALTAEAPSLARLQGRITLDGASPGPWSITSWSQGTRELAEADQATLDSSGQFQIRTAPSPRVELLTLGRARGSVWTLFGNVTLIAGLNTWEHDLRLARVELRGPGVSTTALRYDSERPGVRIHLAPQGWAPESGSQWFVPAGPGQLELRDTRDATAPLVKRGIDLAPGELFILELP